MLVSNHHLAADDTEDLATDRVWAQPFTTGASPTGYVLANVKLLVDASNASPNPRVQVYTFDGQEPGSLVATLNNPATIVADAVNVFTAPAGTELDPSTIYFIVGGYGSDRSKRFVIRTVAGGSEDPASASGWRIDINSLFKGRYSGTSWKRSDKSAYLRVEGAERIAATDATLRGLALSAGTLDPAFAAGTTSYTATVAHHVERVTVMPAANDEARATIAYLDERGNPLADADGTTDGFQVDLEVGDTTIAVEVTAEDRVTTRTYTLTVTRGEALSVMLEANPARLWEGAGPTEVTVTATLDGTWPTDTDITLAVAGSGEANVVGFAAVEDIVLTVPAFARVATATFTLTPDDDLTDERDETVIGERNRGRSAGSRGAAREAGPERRGGAEPPRGAVALADGALGGWGSGRGHGDRDPRRGRPLGGHRGGGDGERLGRAGGGGLRPGGAVHAYHPGRANQRRRGAHPVARRTTTSTRPTRPSPWRAPRR